jgi:hypothetical protein
MQKYELENFMKSFVPEIDFTLEIENSWPCGIMEAKYVMDKNGNGHIHLIPAMQVFTFAHHKFEMSDWDCDGPLGKCVYNTEEDPAMDQCLFCGLPYERK